MEVWRQWIGLNSTVPDVHGSRSGWASGIRGVSFFLERVRDVGKKKKWIDDDVFIRWWIRGWVTAMRRGWNTWETEEESGPRSGLQLRVGADLGRLAHLLLKLSADTIVLLDAQRKGLGRFLRLQLRLARKKRGGNISDFGYRRSLTTLKW